MIEFTLATSWLDAIRACTERFTADSGMISLHVSTLREIIEHDLAEHFESIPPGLVNELVEDVWRTISSRPECIVNDERRSMTFLLASYIAFSLWEMGFKLEHKDHTVATGNDPVQNLRRNRPN